MTPAETLSKLNASKVPFNRYYAFEDVDVDLAEVDDRLIDTSKHGVALRRLIVRDEVNETYYALNFTQHHSDGIDSVESWVEVKRVETVTYDYVLVG